MKRYKALVSQYLDKVSRSVLEKHKDIIREYVRGRHGVYALYRRDTLYYVGLASNLRSRLNQHLKNRHGGSWDRFSIYLTIGGDHLRELESLVLRIVRPQGNKQVGRFARSENLKTRLKHDIRQKMRREVDDLFILRSRASKRATGNGAPNGRNGRDAVLSRYVVRPLKLRRMYKGKLLRARVRRDGMIRFRGTLFASPSKAGAVAARIRACNGWKFWQYERAPGDWVPLAKLRR